MAGSRLAMLRAADDDMTVPFAGTQIHAEHWAPSCLSSKAGSRPGGEFTTHSTPQRRPTGPELNPEHSDSHRPVGPHGVVIGCGDGPYAMASDPGRIASPVDSCDSSFHLACLDLSGPCAPSPLAVYAVKAARLVTDPAIRRSWGNAAGTAQLPESIRSVLCIYCRTDKFVYWPPAWRLPSADCPGCQRRMAMSSPRPGAGRYQSA